MKGGERMKPILIVEDEAIEEASRCLRCDLEVGE